MKIEAVLDDNPEILNVERMIHFNVTNKSAKLEEISFIFQCLFSLAKLMMPKNNISF